MADASPISSFPPISNHFANRLILGSMPGIMSLKANQYYAHPRNAFWRIMAEVYQFKVPSEYGSRIEYLKASGLAVWDVLKSCERSGSLDSRIVNGTRVCNDFKQFFDRHPNIKSIGFNGLEAEKSFNRFVLPGLSKKDFRYTRLPSTSPANTQAFQDKMLAWRTFLLEC